jgi:predicted phage terminase large subunit-like protein
MSIKDDLELQARIMRARVDVDYLCKLIGSPLLPPHAKKLYDIIRRNQKEGRKTVILTAPGCLKSTVLGLCMVQDLLGENPHILFSSRSDKVVKRTGAFLRNAIARIYGPERTKAAAAQAGWKESDEIFMVPGWTPASRDASWVGATLGTGIEGLRANIGYLDDVIDRQSTVSAAYREQALDWLHLTWLDRLDKDAPVTAVGSLWHPKDLHMTLMADGWDTHIFPFARYDRPKLFEPYKNATWHGQEYDWLWPEKWTGVDLNKLALDKGGRIAFGLRFMCDPSTLQNARFKPEWFRFYTDISPEVRARLVIIIGIDPATGKGLLQDAKQDKLSLTGITVIGFDHETATVYVLESIGEFLDPVATKKRIQSLFQQYQVDRILVEDVGYQVGLIKELQMLRLPAFPQSTDNKDKISRIDTLSIPIEQGRILFHATHQDLIEEFLFFPGSDHLDRSDSLEIACREVLLAEPENASGSSPVSTFQNPSYVNWHDSNRGGDGDESF